MAVLHHAAIEHRASHRARDVDRARDGPLVICIDMAQGERREAPAPCADLALPCRIDPHRVAALRAQRLLRDDAHDAVLAK